MSYFVHARNQFIAQYPYPACQPGVADVCAAAPGPRQACEQAEPPLGSVDLGVAVADGLAIHSSGEVSRRDPCKRRSEERVASMFCAVCTMVVGGVGSNVPRRCKVLSPKFILRHPLL